MLHCCVSGWLPAAQVAGDPGFLQHAAAQLQRRREGPQENGESSSADCRLQRIPAPSASTHLLLRVSSGQALTSVMALMRLMGSKHISSVRVKMMTTLRTGLRYREDFPLLCCQWVPASSSWKRVSTRTTKKSWKIAPPCCRTWECFVRSVEPSHLGPLLSHVIVALLPLIPLRPRETAAIIRFLILDNRWH